LSKCSPPTSSTRQRHPQRSDAMTPLAYAAGLFAFLLIMLVLAWCSDEGL
jgi:hypothetical protein